ncbi:hypothetical protein JCM6294_261 [Bacteroides pyogenes DSM 20611 = JCM 6294]|uniref:Uncharacterized protein n=1 Tax=Bacteroides pyogenes DSM 20611 = JCM 6294 TaxID=1121100 RepID=W4PDP9_9BACE|nr:hypothetical protein JCM6294_261 [Bacteroides pyogenes DSM 20611 = JCM 6294]
MLHPAERVKSINATFFAGVLIHTFAAGSGERETVRMWGIRIAGDKLKTKLFINRKICLL